MPLSRELVQKIIGSQAERAGQTIFDYCWEKFSRPLPDHDQDVEILKRDREIAELDMLLAGTAWELWTDYESAAIRTSQEIIRFWSKCRGGKAILLLDGLSLREVPWILNEAKRRNYTLHHAYSTGAELPADTTSFAKSLGFGQRSALENNSCSTHKLSLALTDSVNLPWRDCIELVGANKNFVLWHHWPDKRVHEMCGPGNGLASLLKETQVSLTSDDFWHLINRMTTGRRLIITSDHGYAASGLFPDTVDARQSEYLKLTFKSGRFNEFTVEGESCWVPPLAMSLKTIHGSYQFVLGQRKWKSAGGYPTLTHGGLSLLEVAVPFIELSR